MRRSRFKVLFSLLAVGALLAVMWRFTMAEDVPANNPPEAQPGEPSPPVVGQPAGTTELGGPDRFVVHLSTDKPIYRAEETLYVRGVLLHHETHRPLPDGDPGQGVIEITGPKGDVVASGFVTAENSVLGFAWTVPADQAGGEYTIRASFPFTGYTPAERKFDIRAYRAPRLKSQIEFLRDGYGPADDVVATLHVERAEGGVPAGANVDVVARVDGAEVFRGQTTVNNGGDCSTRFQLPPAIARGEGTLAMIVEDGGVIETASKTIPILLQTVDLTMFPEGGSLIAGVPNRVYLEAFTPAKKPADLAGEVVDESGEVVAEFRSEHEGRGRFSLKPEAGKKYTLRITEPSGISTQYPLPEVADAGATLATDRDRFAADEPIRLLVASNGIDGELKVTLRKREREIGATTMTPSANADEPAVAEFKLKADDPDGVLVATVWKADGTPLAERLIFRTPARQVRVKVTADAERYVPGGQAKLSIETTDEDGKPLSAVVGLTVTDDSVLEMIEKREQAPRLPVMVLLEQEVTELADAHVYLDPENKDAPRQLDLLLGTQGWRRFALVDLPKFLADHADAGRRALAMRIVLQEEWERFGMRWGGFGGGFPIGGAAPAEAEAIFADGAIPLLAAPQAEDRPADAKADAAKSNANAIAPDDASKPGEVPQSSAPPRAADPRSAEEPPAADAGANGPVPARQSDLQVAGGGAPEVSSSSPAKNEELAKQAAGDRAPAIQGALREARDIRARRRIIGNAEQLEMADEMDFASALSIRNDFAHVRIYAHEVRADREPGDRRDFAETLFWHAGVKTDDQGRAEVGFGLNDSVTAFRVFADAFTADGSLGFASSTIESVEPFYSEPKLPLEVTMGDEVEMPLAVVNSTTGAISGVKVNAIARGVSGRATDYAPFTLSANERQRRIYRFRVGREVGNAELTILSSAGPYRDSVTRRVAVRPLGFPVEKGRGGLVAPGETVSYELEIPDDVVPGSVTTRIVVYPTPLASMTEALERLIQEPNGCFEQTSSTVYPLVMAQQYFMSHAGVDPALVERAAKTLDTGHDRLLGFESPSGGFEWFGADPGHDALTAYGLMEFTDMAQVRPVDPKLLERTGKWLLAQRDGKGGFERKTHTYHCWLPEPDLSYTYNTWALLEAGVDGDLSKEVAWVRDAAEKSDNTYVSALGANVLALAGDEEGTNHLLDKLAGKQQPDGSLAGATQSVVGSGGEALAIETTSLAVLAWLKNPRYTEQVESSIKYLAECCKAGRFGSTQSTILALQAIVAYDQSRATPKADGQLQLSVDGQPIGDAVAFQADSQGALMLPDCAELLKPGRHQIQITMTGGSQMPFSVAANFHRTTPDSSPESPLHLEVSLREPKLVEGNVTEAAVSVVNTTGKQLPCPIAIIGIPGGLEPRHDQLKELVKAEKIAAYEVRGREVILYWRTFDAEQRVDLPLSLIAAIPGKYTGPASRAYMYYTDEHKQWVAGLSAEITPRAE